MVAPLDCIRAFSSASSHTEPFSINKPTGVVEGDRMILVVASGYGTSTITGWDNLSAGGNSSANVALDMNVKVAGSSEPSSYSINWTLAGTGSAAGFHAIIVAFRGDRVDPDWDVSPADATRRTVLDTTAPATQSITTSSAEALVFGVWVTQADPPSWGGLTLPAGMTELFDVRAPSTAPRRAITVGLKTVAPGSTGTLTATPAGSAADYVIQVGALPVIPGGLPEVGAGADVASHLVSTEFTRTATEDDNDATITDRSWTITSGPAGSGTEIGTAAALSWTPTTAGTYVLTYEATNSYGSDTDSLSITVVAPAAPTVGAGTDVGSHLIDTAFTRTATESANGATITARSWTIVDGPGEEAGEPAGTTAIFSTSFETGDFTEFGSCQWTGRNDDCSTYDGSSDYSATVVAIDGRTDVFRCEVRNGDVPPFGGGERSEVAEGPGAVVFDGDEVWFAVDVKFPADFPTISDWMIISQLHPNGDLSPTVTLQLLGDDDKLYLTNDEPTSDPINIEIGDIVRGSWVRYIVHFMAGTSTADGWAEVYQDGDLVVSQTPMATVADTDEHYWKWGTYRSVGETVTTVVYLDNVAITHGPQATGGDGEVIGTAAALDWTPTIDGVYILEYAATNSIGTGTDQMSISVVLPSAPTVGAGADVSSHLVNTLFSRTGTASGSGITSRAWTIVSGPAGSGSTIGTAAALSWTPTVSGSYVLRFSATNDGGTGTDDMSITVESGPQPPGSVFDLSNFKWQGPIEDPVDDGDVIEVEQPALDTYLNEDYFYLDSSLRMVCEAPCQGFTTSGSGSTRSELREMEGGTEAAWTPFDDGVRQLTVTERVDPTSLTDRQEMIIGQIHAGDNPAIYIAAEWESSGSPVTPRLRVFKDNLSGGSSGVGNMLSGSLSPTTDFTWRIRVENDTVSVYAAVGGVGNLSGTPNFSYNATTDFADDVGWYFKCGAYNKSEVQDSGTGIAKVTISYLELIQGEEPPPVVAGGGFLPFFAG